MDSCWWVEGDRGSPASRDFPESQRGLGDMGSISVFLCSHFLNIELPRGNPIVSIFSRARASGVEVTGGKSDACGMGWDDPTRGISSSRASTDNAGDSGSSSVNTEARGD